MPLLSTATGSDRNSGVQRPEDELKLLESEAEQYPWLRQGMLKLLEMQFGQDQQGANDGSQNQPSGADAMSGMLGQMTDNGTSALDADAGAGALPGGGVGTLYGAA